MRSIYPISGVSLKAQRLEVYKREGSSDDGTGVLGGGQFRFGALGQLDALACMTEYAQARPTLSTSSAPSQIRPGWQRRSGKKETGVSEIGGVAAARHLGLGREAGPDRGQSQGCSAGWGKDGYLARGTELTVPLATPRSAC